MKGLHAKKDKLELSVETLKRDAEELRGQVDKEEKRLQKEGAAGFAKNNKDIAELSSQRDQLKVKLKKYEEERVKANEELE